MALTKCHACGHDVSTQAKACPTCGAQAKKPSGARLGLFLLAVLGVFGLIGLTTRDRATSDLQSGPPAQAPTPTSTTPPAPDPLMTTTTAEPRRYQASFMAVPLTSAPRPDAREIGQIPMGTVVEAIEKQDFWVKVRVNNTVGWAASTAMERLMDTPAPDLAFVHSGYKVIGNTYRYFFGIRNSGLASYTDPVMLSLYNNGKVIFTHTSTFASDPIRASGGRSFSVDTDAKATRFEFAMKQGKSSGPIGKLIERMSYSSDTSITGGGSMTPRRQYRGRFCGRVLNAWLPVAKRPESSMLRYHLGQHHLEAVGLYLTYMETECINRVLVEIFEMVEE